MSPELNRISSKWKTALQTVILPCRGAARISVCGAISEMRIEACRGVWGGGVPSPGTPQKNF